MTSSYKNVFDSEEEYSRLRNLIMSAIDEYAEYRSGNVTYGEIMFVLEGVLNEMRRESESETGASSALSFTEMVVLVGGLVELLEEKGIVSQEELARKIQDTNQAK